MAEHLHYYCKQFLSRNCHGSSCTIVFQQQLQKKNRTFRSSIVVVYEYYEQEIRNCQLKNYLWIIVAEQWTSNIWREQMRNWCVELQMLMSHEKNTSTKQRVRWNDEFLTKNVYQSVISVHIIFIPNYHIQMFTGRNETKRNEEIKKTLKYNFNFYDNDNNFHWI